MVTNEMAAPAAGLIQSCEEFNIDPSFGCTLINLPAPKLNVI
jgi:hypothetical protein